MVDFKSVWQNQSLPSDDPMPQVVHTLRASEKKRNRTLWWVTLILVATLIFILIVHQLTEGSEFTARFVVGMVLITVAIAWMVGQGFYTRLPLTNQYDQPTAEFRNVVLRKLRLRRQLTVTGPIIYMVLLTQGIQLIAFYHVRQHPYYWLFVGVMYTYIAIVGFFSIRRERRRFRKTYEPILTAFSTPFS